MTPSWWHDALPAFLWQVVLHSTILGFIVYTWTRHVRLPSGSTRRRLLAILLVLPLVTAAVPGRHGVEFRGRLAWFDSGRVLAAPLFAGVHVYHVVLLVAALTVAITIGQEIVPALRRGRSSEEAGPAWVVEVARSLPGWERCRVAQIASTAFVVATGGWPRTPHLVISRGALDRLTREDLEIVVRHEHAHWQPRRWLAATALFAVRLVQSHNPVALWAFREYTVEVEIACDAAAAAGRDPRHVARILLDLYRATAPNDIAAKSTLRKRVDVLLDSARRVDGDALPTTTIAIAAALMLMVLPWFV